MGLKRRRLNGSSRSHKSSSRLNAKTEASRNSPIIFPADLNTKLQIANRSALKPAMAPKSLQHLLTRSICSSCRLKLLHRPLPTRSFSSTPSRHVDSQPPSQPPSQTASRPDAAQLASGLRQAFNAYNEASQSSQSLRDPLDLSAIIDQSLQPTAYAYSSSWQAPEPHHFHIYATKHNCHITLTRPNKEAIISLSAGNIGFRKAQRGSYDAAFQLAAYVMRSIQERGLLRAPAPINLYGHPQQAQDLAETVEPPITHLEIVLRGFGPGREAVTKALLGSEGRLLRGRVVKVSDGTRLKFGGTRSQNPRRLG